MASAYAVVSDYDVVFRTTSDERAASRDRDRLTGVGPGLKYQGGLKVLEKLREQTPD